MRGRILPRGSPPGADSGVRGRRLNSPNRAVTGSPRRRMAEQHRKKVWTVISGGARVDRQRDAGDVPRLVGGQEQHRVADRPPAPPNRSAGVHQLPIGSGSSGPGSPGRAGTVFMVASFMNSGVFTLVGCRRLTGCCAAPTPRRGPASGPPPRAWRRRNGRCGIGLQPPTELVRMIEPPAAARGGYRGHRLFTVFQTPPRLMSIIAVSQPRWSCQRVATDCRCRHWQR